MARLRLQEFKLFDRNLLLKVGRGSVFEGNQLANQVMVGYEMVCR